MHVVVCAHFECHWTLDEQIQQLCTCNWQQLKTLQNRFQRVLELFRLFLIILWNGVWNTCFLSLKWSFNENETLTLCYCSCQSETTFTYVFEISLKHNHGWDKWWGLSIIVIHIHVLCGWPHVCICVHEISGMGCHIDICIMGSHTIKDTDIQLFHIFSRKWPLFSRKPHVQLNHYTNP